MSRSNSVIRVVFVLYGLLLFTGTHWPNLQIHGPIERTDLVVHLGAFGTWAALAALCGFFGAPFSTRNLLLSWLLACAYACFDEGLQDIRWVHRTCAWDDLGFNGLGITLAILVLFGVGIFFRRTNPTSL